MSSDITDDSPFKKNLKKFFPHFSCRPCRRSITRRSILIPFRNCDSGTKDGQFPDKILIGGINSDAREIKPKKLGGMHIVENQPVCPVKACSTSIGYPAGTDPVGILLGSVKDKPGGSLGIGTLAALVLRNNAETGEIVGFKLGDILRGQLGDVTVTENGIPTINDVQLRLFPQLLKVVERHKGEIKMGQKGVALGFNLCKLRLCLRQGCLQFTHARDARVFYNGIRCHLNSKLETKPLTPNPLATHWGP